jgi:hypothetical protein
LLKVCTTFWCINTCKNIILFLLYIGHTDG